jgi:hypothetical protein
MRGDDEGVPLRRGGAVRYGAIRAESRFSAEGDRVVRRRVRSLRTVGLVVASACVAFLAFCQLFTDVSAVQAVSSMGTVGTAYVRYHHAVAKHRFLGGTPGSEDSLILNDLGNMPGNESAALGSCSVGGSSAPANCALPEMATRTCSYTSSCATIPTCGAGHVPTGGQGACGQCRTCTPGFCLRCLKCRKWKCRWRDCNCVPEYCVNVDCRWQVTCTKASIVTNGKCTSCAPFFVARESNTKCIVDPSLTAAYDSTIGAIGDAKSAVTDTMNDINGVITDLTTAIPKKANDISNKIASIAQTIPNAVDNIVSQLIQEAFPADADKFISEITGVLNTASLGVSSTQARSRIVNGKSDHFSTVLAHDRVRAMVREVLGREQTHIPSKESADLGGKCGEPELSVSLPLDDYLPESLVDLSYDMPWPEKLGDSPFSPTTLKAGFPDPSWTMGFKVDEFSFPKKVATDILAAFTAFFTPLFQSIGDGVTDASAAVKNSMMTPISTLKDSVNTAKNTADTVKSKLNAVTQALGGRKLLSDEFETHTEHLRAVHAATRAHLEYAENVHDMFLDRVEHLILLQVAKVRTALLEDPWLEKPHTIAQFPHMHAQLGDSALQQGADAAKQKLISAMQSLKDFTMRAVLFTEMHVEFDVEAQASAFKAGNVLDLVKGLPASAYFEAELPVPFTPFTMKMSFGAELSLPYFMQAEASGKFSYSVDVSGMEVGIQVAGGSFNAVLPDPTVQLTPHLDANLEAHAQVGIVVTVNDISTQLCMPGMVCSGPKMTAEQRIYAGADMAATVNNQGVQACSSLSAKFNDHFEYDDAYRAERCSSANFGGIECSVVVGAYFQIPKTEIDVKLKTDVDIGGVSICVPDLQLYTFPGNTNNPNFVLELA